MNGLLGDVKVATAKYSTRVLILIQCDKNGWDRQEPQQGRSDALQSNGDMVYSSHMRTVTTIDVSKLPDLLSLAEEVRETKKPRMLVSDHETLAMLMPVAKVAKRTMKRAKTQVNYEAFRASAGSLKGLVDEQVMDEIYKSRTVSTQPPLEL